MVVSDHLNAGQGLVCYLNGSIIQKSIIRIPTLYRTPVFQLLTSRFFQNGSARAANISRLPRALEQETSKTASGTASGRRGLSYGNPGRQSGRWVTPSNLWTREQVRFGHLSTVVRKTGRKLVSGVRNIKKEKCKN